MNGHELNEKFEQVYNSKILPHLCILEKERVSLKKQYNILLSILGVVALVAWVLINYASQYLVVFFAVAMTIIFICGFSLTSKRKAFIKKLKSNLLSVLLKMFGNFELSSMELISLNELKKLGLFSKSTIKTDYDVIWGRYKGLEMSITEASLKHITQQHNAKGGTNTSYVEDFNGLILKIKIHKKFSGHTVIKQRPVSYDQFLINLRALNKKDPELFKDDMIRNFDTPIVKAIFNLMQKSEETGVNFTGKGISINPPEKALSKNLESVLLEDVEFNNMFSVYSDDQIEARYLLTTAFMERLKTVSDILFSLGTYCAFKNGYMVLAIRACGFNNAPSGFFEVGDVQETLLNKEIYFKTFKELVAIFDLVHHLKLDQNTGL